MHTESQVRSLGFEMASLPQAMLCLSDSQKFNGVTLMTDIIFVGAAVAFFVVCFAYTSACDRL